MQSNVWSAFILASLPHHHNKIRNPNIEILNKFELPKYKYPKLFGNFNFGIVSDFVFRASNFFFYSCFFLTYTLISPFFSSTPRNSCPVLRLQAGISSFIPLSSATTSNTWPIFISLILAAVFTIGMGQYSPIQSNV